MNAHSMAIANDDTLGRLINTATRRVVLVAPGVSRNLAEVLVKRWGDLGPEAVSVTLDVDPEVCRLGLGEIEAARLLRDTAQKLGTTLNRCDGVRIGVLVADDQTLIYSPTPLLVSTPPKSDTASPRPNAILVGPPPADLSRDLGIGPEGNKEKVVGLDPVPLSTLTAVETEMKTNPPLPFDLTRKMMVYTSNLQFVELRLVGCMLQRRTIVIPSDIIGLADEKTQRLLESKFRLVDEKEGGMWGDNLRRLKDFIVDRYLVHLPTFGQVVRMSEKSRLETAVKALTRKVERERKQKLKEVQTAIDKRVEVLKAALLPGVLKSPPKRWKTTDEEALELLLTMELRKLAGSAADLLDEAKVELRFKGVTYDTLQDPDFINLVKTAMPDMQTLHTESVVAPAARASMGRS